MNWSGDAGLQGHVIRRRNWRRIQQHNAKPLKIDSNALNLDPTPHSKSSPILSPDRLVTGAVGLGYLYFRNLVYFWLRIYHRRNWSMLLVWFGSRLSKTLAGIGLLERERGRKLKACLIGIRDGFRGRLDGTFED
jgi:hypothetical protein